MPGYHAGAGNGYPDSIMGHILLSFIKETAPTYGDENHETVILNFHPFFIPLNQLIEAILDLGFWIADLLYRFALSFFIKSTEYLKSEI
jgi:hypothetical protein